MKRDRHQETSLAAPAQASTPAWHCLPTADVSAQLGTDVAVGLARAEAASRLASYGPNEIQEREKRGPWRMFLGQFTDFMILLLLGRRRSRASSASSRTPRRSSRSSC